MHMYLSLNSFCKLLEDDIYSKWEQFGPQRLQQMATSLFIFKFTN